MLTDEQIDGVVLAGSYHNAAGGIYATSVYDFARAVEAATLATVTPLVQQLVDVLADASDDSDEALNRMKAAYGTNYRKDRIEYQEHVVKQCAAALTAARAFLSGATKESTDHG